VAGEGVVIVAGRLRVAVALFAMTLSCAGVNDGEAADSAGIRAELAIRRCDI
jgi:hypothetical protein